MKPYSYALGEKIWLHNKYIKTKQNLKFKGLFFGLFQVFHLIDKQTYKLKLLTK